MASASVLLSRRFAAPSGGCVRSVYTATLQLAWQTAFCVVLSQGAWCSSFRWEIVLRCGRRASVAAVGAQRC